MAENNYDEIPVYYCKECLSLGVVSECGMEYCKDCGSTDIGTSKIDEWEQMYERRYGHKLVNKRKR